jgi:hypothetical protein
VSPWGLHLKKRTRSEAYLLGAPWKWPNGVSQHRGGFRTTEVTRALDALPSLSELGDAGRGLSLSEAKERPPLKTAVMYSRIIVVGG